MKDKSASIEEFNSWYNREKELRKNQEEENEKKEREDVCLLEEWESGKAKRRYESIETTRERWRKRNDFLPNCIEKRIKTLEYARNYYRKNRKKKLEQGKKYRETNRKQLLITRRNSYLKNREKILRQQKEYRIFKKTSKDKIIIMKPKIKKYE